MPLYPTEQPVLFSLADDNVEHEAQKKLLNKLAEQHVSNEFFIYRIV
jgi:hypothetical protein